MEPETGAHQAHTRFLRDHVQDYAGGRDIPSEPNTSETVALPPVWQYLARQVWHAAQHAERKHPKLPTRSINSSVNSAGGSFAITFCSSFHTCLTRPSIPNFLFPMGERRGALTGVANRQTGYPIVDAGMPELWQTGFMHNRVRMVVASFLTNTACLTGVRERRGLGLSGRRRPGLKRLRLAVGRRIRC